MDKILVNFQKKFAQPNDFSISFSQDDYNRTYIEVLKRDLPLNEEHYPTVFEGFKVKIKLSSEKEKTKKEANLKQEADIVSPNKPSRKRKKRVLEKRNELIE